MIRIAHFTRTLRFALAVIAAVALGFILGFILGVAETILSWRFERLHFPRGRR